MWIVRLSLNDSSAAISAGRRVAAICRQLSADEWGNRELWQTVEQLFEISSVETSNAAEILASGRTIKGQGDEKTTLRVLTYVLATWHANPHDAIHCQLACAETLLSWFDPLESVYRLILLPYLESYWQRIVNECRFRLRSPDLTVAGIEAAMSVSETKRAQTILCAAAGGFHIQGLGEALSALHRTLPCSSSP
jgi:hypothetical protein